MEGLNKSIQELLSRDPEVARAVDEVDRTLIREALELSPLERLQAATKRLKALRRFRRVTPQGS